MTVYSFYQYSYHGGTIPQEDWPYYEARASDQLARYKRIYTVTVPEDTPNGEDLAVCALAETLYGFDLLDNGEGGSVQSTSIGSVSVSYGASASQMLDLSEKGREKELYRIACRYLDIYRG